MNVIETLTGERVEIPDNVPHQYPYQIQEYAAKLAKSSKDPQVYVFKFSYVQNGEEKVNSRKFYSDACWELETFALEMFEQLCKDHDWYYQYSDDHRVWTKGRDEYSRLQSKYQWMLTKCPESAKAIWEQYNPFLKVEQHA